MKKVLLALALIVMLSVLASAENDSVTTGPYKISFNLGLNKSTYSVEVKDPVNSESLSGSKKIVYSFTLKNKTDPNNRLAMIDYTWDETGYIDPGQLSREAKLRSIVNSNYATSNIDIASRPIDSTEGSIASFRMFGLTSYMVVYIPIIDNHLLATIASTYPWDEGSLQLLKTIHIEKLNATKTGS